MEKYQRLNQKEKSSMKFKILMLGFVLIFGLIASYWTIKNRQADVYKWASNNSYTIESIDSHWTVIHSPFFYLGKNEIIFDVWLTTSDNAREHWWIRTNFLFGNDYVKE